MKHTPGPWEVLNQTDVFTKSGAKNAHGEIAASNDGWMVCTTMYGITLSVSGDETELPITEKFANARLIAAAPELLKALEMVRDADDDDKKDGGPGMPSFARMEVDAAIAKAKGAA